MGVTEFFRARIRRYAVKLVFSIRRKRLVYHFCNSGFKWELKINLGIRHPVLHLFFGFGFGSVPINNSCLLFLYVRSEDIVRSWRNRIVRSWRNRPADRRPALFVYESLRINDKICNILAIKIYPYLNLPLNNCPEFFMRKRRPAGRWRAERRIVKRSTLRGQARVRQQSEARTRCQCCIAAQYTVSERRNLCQRARRAECWEGPSSDCGGGCNVTVAVVVGDVRRPSARPWCRGGGHSTDG